MRRWAYYGEVIAAKGDRIMRRLAELGEQGWELTAALPGWNNGKEGTSRVEGAYFMFKRPEQMLDPSRAELT